MLRYLVVQQQQPCDAVAAQGYKASLVDPEAALFGGSWGLTEAFCPLWEARLGHALGLLARSSGGWRHCCAAGASVAMSPSQHWKRRYDFRPFLRMVIGLWHRSQHLW